MYNQFRTDFFLLDKEKLGPAEETSESYFSFVKKIRNVLFDKYNFRWCELKRCPVRKHSIAQCLDSVIYFLVWRKSRW